MVQYSFLGFDICAFGYLMCGATVNVSSFILSAAALCIVLATRIRDCEHESESSYQPV